MRMSVYVTVVAFLVSVVFVFTSTPVPAQMMKDESGTAPMMEQSGAPTSKQKTQMKDEAQRAFSGEAKTGTAGEEKAKTETKAGEREKREPGVSSKSGMEMRGESKTGQEAKPMMKGEEKARTSPEPKAGVSSQGKQRPMGEAMKERSMKPETRSPVERGPGMSERKDIGVRQQQGAARSEFPAQAQGGAAVVVRVDRPENCLRIRSDASSSADIINCVSEGQTLHLTGVFSEDRRWAQLDSGGWVYFKQLRSDVAPAQASVGEGSWEQPAAAGKEAKKGSRGHYRGNCYYYGSGYYWYPRYHHWGWGY